MGVMKTTRLPDDPDYGLCECGCKRQTKVADQTRRGNERGVPHRFVRGHSLYKALSDKERFDQYVYPDPNSGCHIWAGKSIKYGYGRFNIGDGRYVLAHRFAWEHEHGERLADDVCVLHKCDTPSCVNPEHLFLGTRADNARDRSRKNRTRRGPYPRGVYKKGSGYAASVCRPGAGTQYLGTYPTVEAAFAVASAARAEVYAAQEVAQ